MTTPNFVILYVDQPSAERRLLQRVLGRQRSRPHRTFVLFVVDTASSSASGRAIPVDPAPRPPAVARDRLCAGTPGAVDATHADLGGTRAEDPADADRHGFRRTFVALDPDQHRLRVYCLSDAEQS